MRLRDIPGEVFTRTECILFCNIAVSYMNEGNLSEALNLMRQMQKYFETTRIDEEERCISEGLHVSHQIKCRSTPGTVPWQEWRDKRNLGDRDKRNQEISEI